MDSAIKRLIDNTGASMPLAAQVLNYIQDSGATYVEARTALHLVDTLLPRLDLSYSPVTAELDDLDSIAGVVPLVVPEGAVMTEPDADAVRRMQAAELATVLAGVRAASHKRASRLRS